MVRNSAGGRGLSRGRPFTRLRRFLALGSEGGSYYATERKLTVENANAVKRCIEIDGRRVVDEAVRARPGRRAPERPAPLCAGHGGVLRRRRTFAVTPLSVLPQVARTGSHLFRFVELRRRHARAGARALRRAIGAWYEAQGGVAPAAYQMVKYRQRNGWTHRDLLRKAPPVGQGQSRL